MPRSNLEYSGGGCALNTVRVFQWLSPSPNSAVFLGGLGKVGRYPLRMSSIANGRMTAGPSLKASSTVTPFSLHLPNRSVRCTLYRVHARRQSLEKYFRTICPPATVLHLWRALNGLWQRILGRQTSSHQKICGRGTTEPCWREPR